MNNPFRYAPSEEIQALAVDLFARIDSDPALSAAFSEGKMLGILRVRGGVLYGFSGNAAGRNRIDGFVPPVFDLLDPDGHFKKEEAEISEINHRIQSLLEDTEYEAARQRTMLAKARLDRWTVEEKEKMAASKAKRARDRESGARPWEDLIRESQFEKAEFRRGKKGLEAILEQARSLEEAYTHEINLLRAQTKARSDSLQNWIFDQFTVHNALGECRSIAQIFRDNGITAPGGTGECAGIKLLEFAFRNGLEPVELGELWYGKPLGDGLRQSGVFYPSCNSKCAPLMGFMLKGLQIDEDVKPDSYRIAYIDREIIVADKPSGMLSVPGRTGDISLLDLLEKEYGEVLPVHRLDMDTSGLILFARNPEVQQTISAAFENRLVQKHYYAVIDGPVKEDSGTISLSIAPDWDNRPRQKVAEDGKEARTLFQVTRRLHDGRTEVLLKPLTGRTHQLRIHCVHPSGLGHPISGDRLYGSKKTGALLLHAAHLELRYDSKIVSIDSPRPSYWPED